MKDKKNNDSIPTTASDSPTNNAKLTENLNVKNKNKQSLF